MTGQLFVTLNDGRKIPQLGLGVWRTTSAEAPVTIRTALEVGYRHIDTATMYENEEGVGEGLRISGLAREDIFVTTKLWNDDQGYDNALRAFDASLARLGTDYIDLYLIHWPAPTKNLYVDTWKALIELRKQGRARSIGVSNFNAEHLERLIGETGVTPALNQIELHPRFQRTDLRAFHASRGIVTELWGPLGRGTLLGDPVIVDIATKHGRTPAQIIIRWHLDLGLVVIPKSVTPSRIADNFNVFDFVLDEQDMAAMASLDLPDGRIGPDPQTADF